MNSTELENLKKIIGFKLAISIVQKIEDEGYIIKLEYNKNQYQYLLEIEDLKNLYPSIDEVDIESLYYKTEEDKQECINILNNNNWLIVFEIESLDDFMFDFKYCNDKQEIENFEEKQKITNIYYKNKPIEYTIKTELN